MIPHLRLLILPSGAVIQILPSGGGYLYYGNQRQVLPSLTDVWSFIHTQLAVTSYNFFHEVIINLITGTFLTGGYNKHSPLQASETEEQAVPPLLYNRYMEYLHGVNMRHPTQQSLSQPVQYSASPLLLATDSQSDGTPRLNIKMN